MSATPPYREAVRLQTSVLAAAERRLLVRLAHRMPRWVNSDHLTAAAGLAMLGIGACFWAGRPAAIAAVLPLVAINWLGDSLDGTLARVRLHERPRYGYYVDHVLDAAGTGALFGGLTLGGFMTPAMGLGFLAAYYLLVVEVALATHARGTFRMSFWRIGPTELRIVLAAGALQLLHSPTVHLMGRTYLLFDIGGAIAIAGLLATCVASAVRNASALYREEPLGRM